MTRGTSFFPPGDSLVRLLERLGHRLPFRVGQDQLDLLFPFLETLVAEARKADPFFEESQGLVERNLFSFQALDDLLQLLESLLEFVGTPGGHARAVYSTVPSPSTPPSISGQRLSTPSVRESTVASSRPFFNCTSICSPTWTCDESRIGLRFRFVRENAIA